MLPPFPRAGRFPGDRGPGGPPGRVSHTHGVDVQGLHHNTDSRMANLCGRSTRPSCRMGSNCSGKPIGNGFTQRGAGGGLVGCWRRPARHWDGPSPLVQSRKTALRRRDARGAAPEKSMCWQRGVTATASTCSEVSASEASAKRLLVCCWRASVPSRHTTRPGRGSCERLAGRLGAHPVTAARSRVNPSGRGTQVCQGGTSNPVRCPFRGLASQSATAHQHLLARSRWLDPRAAAVQVGRGCAGATWLFAAAVQPSCPSCSPNAKALGRWREVVQLDTFGHRDD